MARRFCDNNLTAACSPNNGVVRIECQNGRSYLSGRGAFGAVHATFPFRATGSLLARIDLTRSADDAPSSDNP